MKAAKTWCLAGLMLVAGLSSASCGKDEGTDGGGGHGTVLGGSGGSGGITGRSGGGGSDTAGGDAPTSTTKLGRACLNAKDCVDPAAPGLTCITSKDTVLDNGAPPKGLCTTTCTMPQGNDDDPCAAFGPNGKCFPFGDSSGNGYCVEGCSFGMPDIGEAKCHSRPEFNCNPALLGPTGTACTTSDDCSTGDVCSQGECAVVITACLPGCRGDLDCDAGMFCDQSFLTGTCVTKPNTGKGLGEPCTVPAATAPDEPDECIGFCQADATGSSKGHCSTNCGLGRECSWNPQTEKYDGICFYGSALDQDTGSIGDFGFCTPSCNCTDDCNDSRLACSLLSQGALSTDFRGAGLCFAPPAANDPTAATFQEYNQCMGTGGASGGAGPDSGGGASGDGAGAGASAGGVGGAG